MCCLVEYTQQFTKVILIHNRALNQLLIPGTKPKLL